MVSKSLSIKVALFLFAVSASCTSCGVFKEAVGTPAKPSHTGTHIDKSELRLRHNIVTEAKKYVGVKYRYGGKTPTGFDCSGFVTYVMEKNGVPVSGPSYSQENLGAKISSKQAQPGDLIFFRKTRTGKVYHVAMVYGNDNGSLTVIHATSSRGVVLERLSDNSYWRTKYVTLRNVIGS